MACSPNEVLVEFDFKSAFHGAIEEIWPNTLIRGCWFLLGQFCGKKEKIYPKHSLILGCNPPTPDKRVKWTDIYEELERREGIGRPKLLGVGIKRDNVVDLDR